MKPSKLAHLLFFAGLALVLLGGGLARPIAFTVGAATVLVGFWLAAQGAQK